MLYKTRYDSLVISFYEEKTVVAGIRLPYVKCGWLSCNYASVNYKNVTLCIVLQSQGV